MTLIVAMYINQAIHVSINWYLSWLAYIKYGGSSEAMAMFTQTEEIPLTVIILFAVENLLVTIRLGIADSIMVFFIITAYLMLTTDN